MSAVTKALAASRGRTNTVHAQAVRLKAEGGLAGVIATDGGMGGFGAGQNQAGNNQRYNQFRGWLYAAVNALASEGAAQPVNMAKRVNADPNPENRATMAGIKAYHQKKMTRSIRSKTTGTDLEVITDHPMLDALENPNPIQSRYQFVYSFIANLNLTGWAYIISATGADGRLEFYSLPTTWVTPNHEQGPFTRFKVANPKEPHRTPDDVWFTREQVAFAHLPNPADPMGAIAPAQSQVMAIRIDDHIQTSQDNFFHNGIFPSVIVTVGKQPMGNGQMVRPRLNAPQRRQIYQAIGRTMSSVSNYGAPGIVDGMIEKIERLSATQTEMGWEKSENKVRTRILSAFNVHPYILGEPVNAGGYAQVAKIEERFCKRVNIFLDMLSNVMTHFAGPMVEQNDRTLIWWEKCEPHDPALHWQNMREARKQGDITRDEMRAALGFPPTDPLLDVIRSPLLSTVGGMTGAVQIFNAMGLGNIAPETAAQLLALFFEIPQEQATAIVGVGSIGIPEAVQELQAAVSILKEPVKVDIDNTQTEKLLKQAIEIATNASNRADAANEQSTESAKAWVKTAELISDIEAASKEGHSELLADTKQAASFLKAEIEKVGTKFEAALVKEGMNRDNSIVINDVLATLSDKVDGSFEVIQDAIKQKQSIIVHNEVRPTPVQVEVKPPNVKVAVTNEVQPTDVLVENNVEAPNVIVSPAPITVEAPVIDIPQTVVNVAAPEVTVKPEINVEAAPAQVTVIPAKCDPPPKKAVITHPDGKISQVKLED